MLRTPLVLILLAAALTPQPIATPADHFGFEPGEDGRLLTWAELSSYYRLLAEASPHLRLQVVGPTTEGREMLLLVLSGRPEAELESLRLRQEDLARGRLDPEALAEVLAHQPAVVYVQGNLHSTEVASSLLFPALLHRLATGTDETTQRIRDNVVLLAVPSANPDGLDRVVRWYSETRGTPWEGTSPPDLYHVYAGHDNNRDWFMLSLQETRLLTRILYREWFPEIVLDIHQMGSSGARMFVPPFADPVSPHVPPLLSRMMDLAGTHMALTLSQEGLTGVVQDVIYDNYWDGGARNVPFRHNMVGILTETASARLASPVWKSREDLRGHGVGLPEYRAQGNFPEPWPGGWWRLSDILRYQSVSTWALLDLAARFREMFLQNFHQLARQAIRKGQEEPPHAFLVPADQEDRGAVWRLVENLRATGLEVWRARSPFSVDGVAHEAGTFVIPTAQAFQPHLRDLLEPQVYPAIRAVPEGEVLRPYDASAWTLPLQFGIRVQAAGRPLPLEVELEAVTVLPPPETSFEGGLGAMTWTLPADANAAFLLVNRALQHGLQVHRESSERGGDFLFSGRDEELLGKLGTGLGLRFRRRGHDREGGGSRDLPGTPLSPPRVGILRPWPPSIDAGWTHLVLEEHGFSPQMPTFPEIRAGQLARRLDALILPDASPAHLTHGAGEGRLPPPYQGGLGVAGAEALRDFVREGGQLLAFARAVPYVVELFGFPLENGLAPQDKDAKDRFLCPGSLLRVQCPPPESIGDLSAMRAQAGASPLLAGRPPRGEFAIFLDDRLALRVQGEPPGIWPVLTYPASDPLLAGDLRQGERLCGLAALVEARVGAGRVLLYAFRPQHRSQTLGTFRLVFNALYGRSK